jgi:hypothetical protein
LWKGEPADAGEEEEMGFSILISGSRIDTSW